jgi:hypothetical protein
MSPPARLLLALCSIRKAGVNTLKLSTDRAEGTTVEPRGEIAAFGPSSRENRGSSEIAAKGAVSESR